MTCVFHLNSFTQLTNSPLADVYIPNTTSGMTRNIPVLRQNKNKSTLNVAFLAFFKNKNKSTLNVAFKKKKF